MGFKVRIYRMLLLKNWTIVNIQNKIYKHFIAKDFSRDFIWTSKYYDGHFLLTEKETEAQNG